MKGKFIFLNLCNVISKSETTIPIKINTIVTAATAPLIIKKFKN